LTTRNGSRSSNGTLELRLRGDAGLIYGIDTSTGLAGWARWLTRTNLTGEIQWTETGLLVVPHRFYRATIEPPQP
jgi:hypothetical protein